MSDEPTLGLSFIDLAVIERDSEILHKLIKTKSYSRINETDEEGCSAFHRLDSGHWRHTFCDIKYSRQLFRKSPQQAQLNLREIIRTLFEHEENINQLTKPKKLFRGGITPLMLAMTANQLETIEELLKADADVNIQNKKRENVLFCLLVADTSFGEENFSKIFKLLVSYNADIHCERDDSFTFVLIQNNYVIVDFLYDMSVDIESRIFDNNLYNFREMTTLARILHDGTNDPACVNLLLKHLSPINDRLKKTNLIDRTDLRGQTLLQLTSESEMLKSVQVLIDQKAEINAVYTHFSFRKGRGSLKISETALDRALYKRDALLDTLYRREETRFSKAGETYQIQYYFDYFSSVLSLLSLSCDRFSFQNEINQIFIFILFRARTRCHKIQRCHRNPS